MLSGGTLYGTTTGGGSGFSGVVFQISTDGSHFTTLHEFNGDDGASPAATLVLTGQTLYGTTAQGGGSGSGTVFSLSFPPQLTIIPSGPYVILTWPTNYAGFDYTGFTLQSTTNLVSPAVWTTTSPGPVLIGGQNVVINTVSGTQQFYRLIQ